MRDEMPRPTCATCSEADVLLRPGGERDRDLVWCRWLGGTMHVAAWMGCHTPSTARDAGTEDDRGK